MAKKSSTVVDENSPSSFFTKKIIDDHRKTYGDILQWGTETLNRSENLQYIPLSPSHDHSLCGGIREGSWVIMSGMPGLGKTTTALQLLANAQQEENGSRVGLYDDAEARLKDRNLTGVHGLDASKLIHIIPQELIITAEDSLQIVEDFLRNNERCVVIIDSVSNFLSAKEAQEEKINGEGRSKLPRILANFIRRNAAVVPSRRHIVVMITHQMADLSMSRRTKTSDGGNAIQFQADVVLEITHKTPWLDGEKIVGQFVHWELVKTSGKAITGTKYTSALRYGYGIDDIYEIIPQAVELGVMIKSGAWYKCDYFDEDDKGDRKLQGISKVSDFLTENPDAIDKIKKELHSLLAS